MNNVKKFILSSFWGEYAVSILHEIEGRIITRFVSDETAIKKSFRKNVGREINLSNPQTFSEKLNWYKLNYRNPMMTMCVDKANVRDYVQKKGYCDLLNECYGIYDDVNEIDIESLPQQFVLKATHGTHMNVIVKNKNELNWRHSKKLLTSWLRQDIYWWGREWAYKDVPHRIIAEKYLEDLSGELRDYKFFCFHGMPAYFEYDIGRFSGQAYRNYYDMNMELLPIFDGTPSLAHEKPPISTEQFEQMKRIAMDLSSDFPQVRIDLYVANEKIYFGEMTFYDGGGATVFSPDEWNIKFSENWIVK